MKLEEIIGRVVFGHLGAFDFVDKLRFLHEDKDRGVRMHMTTGFMFDQRGLGCCRCHDFVDDVNKNKKKPRLCVDTTLNFFCLSHNDQHSNLKE